MMRLSLRELARRIELLQAQLKTVFARLHRITKTTAPQLVAIKGVGPDVASTLLVTAGDNPHRLQREQSFAALCGVSQSRSTAARSRTPTASIEAATGKPTAPCGASRS